LLCSAINQLVTTNNKYSFLSMYLNNMLAKYSTHSLFKKIAQKQIKNFARKKISMKTELEHITKLFAKKFIAVQTTEEIVLININDIIYCSSHSNYTHLWLLNNKKVVITKTLGAIEKQINSTLFFRIHQSYLINVLWLSVYKKGKGGNAIMIDNTILEVSSRKREAFIKYLSQLAPSV
jgi:two-component system, LytTR family, response regulator